jgi:hypothetical protein
MSIKRAIHLSLIQSVIAGLLLSSQSTFIAPAQASATIGEEPCVQTVNDSTGVTVTKVGSDCVISFTSTGINYSWTVPAGVTAVRALLVAGGGAGAGGLGGGGGAGEMLETSAFDLTPGANISITVGAGGGARAWRPGDPGQNSIFSTLTAHGGGGGGSENNPPNVFPPTDSQSNFGSGGGGGYNNSTSDLKPVNSRTLDSPLQGFRNQGGAGSMGGGNSATGGGGGGAGGAGVAGNSSDQSGGAGGAGRNSDITGTSKPYAGGGGGGLNGSSFSNSESMSNGTPGTGGSGIGGNGGAKDEPNNPSFTCAYGTQADPTNGCGGEPGTANTGSGGGGGSNAQFGGDGGSGIVIVRYTVPEPSATPSITAQPASITKAVDETATFSVTAASTAGTLSYQWELSTNGTSWSAISGATSTSHTTGSLTTSSSGYKYRVVVTNTESGKSPVSVTSSVATLTVIARPAKVENLIATAGDKQVSLAWTAPSDGGSALTNYVIERTTNNFVGGETPVLTEIAATSPSYVVTGLTNGQKYFFRVSAKNSVGTGTPSDTASTTPYSDIDYALNFDGVDDHLKISGAKVIADTGDYTIEAWVYQDPTTVNTDVIVYHGSLPGSRTYIATVKTSSTNFIKIGLDGNFDKTTTATMPLDEWVHVALTRNGNKYTLYLNGTAVDSGTVNRGSFSNDVYVGRSAAGDRWKGKIDQVKFYSTALTAAQVIESMHAWGAASGATLTAHLDFNDASTSTVFDNTTNNKNFTVFGTVAGTAYEDIRKESTVDSKKVFTFLRSYLTDSGGWKVPADLTSAHVLVVGGGGGGGGTGGRGWSGGGGAGGSVVEQSSYSLSNQTQVTIKVGAGGGGGSATVRTQASDFAQSGSNSSIGDLTAAGGGPGGDAAVTTDYEKPLPANDGGAPKNGGGGSAQGSWFEGAARIDNESFKGGKGFESGTDSAQAGGGGSGAGGSGSDATSGTGGTGGDGVSSSITSSSNIYGGGGGGGKRTSGTAGSGRHGGANGGANAVGSNATANRGGGGGGGGGDGNAAGGNGGSGVVIVKYANPQLARTI